jgi:hypothetical protein
MPKHIIDTGNQSISGTLTSDIIIANTLVAGISSIYVSLTSGNVGLSASYVNKFVNIDSLSATNVIVPQNSTISIPSNSVITLFQQGAGILTLTPEVSSVVLNSYDNGLKSAGQYSALQIIKINTDVWNVVGGAV